MRLAPDEGPGHIRRYMLPDEEIIVAWRQNLASLIPHAIMAVGGLLATVIVSPLLQGITSLQRTMWILITFLFARLVMATAYRHRQYFAVTTSHRLIQMCGVLTPRIVTTPLTNVTNITFEPSVGGRIFGHGTLVLEYADRADSIVQYIPDSEQVYSALSEAVLSERTQGETHD